MIHDEGEQYEREFPSLCEREGKCQSVRGGQPEQSRKDEPRGASDRACAIAHTEHPKRAIFAQRVRSSHNRALHASSGKRKAMSTCIECACGACVKRTIANAQSRGSGLD